MPNKKPAQIFHFDSFGKRQEKYDRLTNTTFQDVAWKELQLKEPYYFFVPKDFEAEEKYNKGFKIDEIFNKFSTGIQSGNDNLFIGETKYELLKKLEEIAEEKINQSLISEITYRTFDKKYIYYIKNFQSNNYKNIVVPKSYRSRYEVMSNLDKVNIGMVLGRQGQAVGGMQWNLVSIVNSISDLNLFYRGGGSIFPLYLYQQNPLEKTEEKTPNFNTEVIEKIEKKLGLHLSPDSMESGLGKQTFSPEDLFDYIYAVLHSKTYRETYKEFLKIDFPKVPFDCDKETFFKMRDLGKELRSYHLMENENLIPKNFITTYPVDGDNEVGKVKYTDEKVFINDEQYFDGIPKEVFEFYIGGYQPAQKWLKDRKGRELNYEDILHYSKIILCLKETIRIMEEIEVVFKV